MVKLAFGGSVVDVSDSGTLVTLADGATVPGTPQDTDEYRQNAARYGYGDDTLRMCQDHDTTHAALAHFLGLSESPTLRSVAVGNGGVEVSSLEETAVLAIQRLACALGIDLVERYQYVNGCRAADGQEATDHA